MKTLLAFLRLIRWNNLVFIAITQLLFYYFIVVPNLPTGYEHLSHKIDSRILLLLVIASIFIAAAGYIINDYFDIDIDQVNKPGKVVVEKLIKRRWAILLHLMFTTIGVVISAYVALKTNKIILFGNIICTLLLWLYSTSFKKKLLSGNIIIAVLTAWTVFVLYFATNTTFIYPVFMQHIYKFAVLYGGFAFIVSLVREVVKDMEDMIGDEAFRCKTIPIVWGIPAAKMYAGVWLIVLIGSLFIIQVYALLLGWWISSLYSVLFIIAPLIFILQKLFAAKSIQHYHNLSKYIKLTMLAGILSMIFLNK